MRLKVLEKGENMKILAKNVKSKIIMCVMTLALAFSIIMVNDNFAIVSHATSQCKVIADSAKIRSEAGTGSTVIGSAKKGDELSIKSQVAADDGHVWYYVFVNAEKLGYIRSDLVEITDGSTPSTSEPSGNSETSAQQPAVNENPDSVEVEKVNPVNGTIVESSSIRVRKLPSTSSSIVASAKKGLVVTINGQTTGTDGYVWFKVSYTANSESVEGFIRSDFVTPDEEVTPYVEEVPDEITEEAPVEVIEEPVVKDWDTKYDDDKQAWYLVDNLSDVRYGIDDVFKAAEENAKMFNEANKKAKNELIIIVVLVIVAVVLAGAVILLIMKLRDADDDEMYPETMNRRPVSPRPQGARPEGARPQTVRPEGSRPQTARPEGARPQGSRPQTVRPEGARPQGARPMAARPMAARPEAARPETARPKQPVQDAPRPQNNRVYDDDEFEFDFLSGLDD